MSVEEISLQALSRQKLDEAHALSRAVAWPHRREDWETMFELGQGFAALGRDGRLQGVAMWWPQGSDFATLGMVIVSPTLQKAGLGRRLMDATLRAAGSRSVQLNATEAGLKLYRSLGFEETGGIHQHHGSLSPAAVAVDGAARVRPLVAADHGALRALDRHASGVDRSGVLQVLLPLSAGFALDGPNGLAGYLLVRDFGRGTLLGPLVAQDEGSALELLSHAAVATGGFLRADIPDDAARLAQWLEGAGLAPVSAVRTMVRGPRPVRAGGAHIFGLVSQALG